MKLTWIALFGWTLISCRTMKGKAVFNRLPEVRKPVRLWRRTRCVLAHVLQNITVGGRPKVDLDVSFAKSLLSAHLSGTQDIATSGNMPLEVVGSLAGRDGQDFPPRSERFAIGHRESEGNRALALTKTPAFRPKRRATF